MKNTLLQKLKSVHQTGGTPGFLYLAVFLDAFSRRIVGWAMGNTLKAQIVLDA
jgi:transposase InsO family protein